MPFVLKCWVCDDDAAVRGGEGNARFCFYAKTEGCGVAATAAAAAAASPAVAGVPSRSEVIPSRLRMGSDSER